MRFQFIRLTTVMTIMLFAHQNLIAQNTMPVINSVVPVAPNAASLGKYGEIPIGLYTGIPNISIPLYNAQSGNLKLPVSISYHAAGMRIEEMASWVGLGWSLNAGGVICRQVRGIADETTGLGYVERYDSLNAYFNGMALERKLNYFRSVQDNTYDSQQDIFSYNIGGESGKFVFLPGGGTISIPLTKNKFEYGNFQGQDSSWKLTDVDGTVYYFTARETNTAVPHNNGTISAGTTNISSWYLTKMISASGKDSISFSYDLSVTHFNTSITQTKYISNAADSYCYPKDNDNVYSKTLVHGRRLREIEFATGHISLFPKSTTRDDFPDDYALDSIVIVNTDSSFYQKYKFYQSYNTGTGAYGTPTDELKRMFLDSVVMSDESNRINRHAFVYNQSTTFPARNSYDQDHWGYFNGASNTVDFVPTTNLKRSYNPGYYIYESMNIPDSNFIIVAGADRNPDSSVNQLGILTSIIYPTGGKTEFEYETNKAVNFPRELDYVTDYTGFSTLTSCNTTFTVDENYAGTGGVNATISINNGGGACAELGGLACPVVLISGPSGTFNIYTSETRHFLQKGTYSVTVDLSAVYDPDIIDNFSLDILWGRSAFSDSFFTYNANVGGLRIKKITNYASIGTKAAVKKYTYVNPDFLNRSSGQLVGVPEYLSRVILHSRTTVGTEDINYDCDFATISSGSNYPLLTTQGSYVGYQYVQEYLGENGEFGKNEYTYTDSYTYPDTVSNKPPFAPANVKDWKRGQLLKTKNYSFNTATSTYQLLQEKNMTYYNCDTIFYRGLKVSAKETWSYTPGAIVFDTAIFKTTTGWFPPISDTTRLFDQNDLSKYSQMVTTYGYGLNHYQPITVKTNNSKGDTIRQFMKYPLDYSSLSGSDALTVGIKNLQDKNIVSPVIEKYTQMGTDFRTTKATITSYKPVLPLPDTLFTTELSGTTTSFSPTFVSGGSIVKSGLYQPQVSLNKYDDNGNIVEQQKLKDAKHTYLWDYSASYPVAEVTNADSANIAYTSFETGVTGNWAVSSGSPAFVSNSASPTGTRYYTLTGTTLQKTGLNTGTTYIVSYWSSTGTNYSVSGTVSSTKTGTTIGGWTYIEHEVTGAGSISVSGTGSIDELRLYPKEALMTTYTYQPLAGITSQCDAGNRITYYEYDSLGRLLLVKDEKRKIIKTISYQYH